MDRQKVYINTQHTHTYSPSFLLTQPLKVQKAWLTDSFIQVSVANQSSVHHERLLGSSCSSFLLCSCVLTATDTESGLDSRAILSERYTLSKISIWFVYRWSRSCYEHVCLQTRAALSVHLCFSECLCLCADETSTGMEMYIRTSEMSCKYVSCSIHVF